MIPSTGMLGFDYKTFWNICPTNQVKYKALPNCDIKIIVQGETNYRNVKKCFEELRYSTQDNPIDRYQGI